MVAQKYWVLSHVLYKKIFYFWLGLPYQALAQQSYWWTRDVPTVGLANQRTYKGIDNPYPAALVCT